MKRVSLIATALTMLCLTTAIEAKHHGRIVAIGNSETDSGNSPFGFYTNVINFPTGIVWPQFPSFSNGAKWVVQLGDMWGDDVQPSRLGGLNFACSGAQTGLDTNNRRLASVRTPGGGADIPIASIPAISTFNIPSMRTQTNEFLSQKKHVSKKAVIFHDGAFNNLLQDFLAPPFDPAADAVVAVNDTVANLTALKKAGYKNQVTFNLQSQPIWLIPPFLPFIPSASVDTFINTFNANLLPALKNAKLRPVVIDLQSLHVDLLSNLGFYGFTGGLGPMANVTGPNNTFFWFDGLHLSEQHEFLMSQYIFNILEAPECWGHLAAQPFAMMRNQNAVLRQELYPIVDLCEGELYPFISGSYMPTEAAPFAGGKAHDTSGWNGTLGFAYRALPHWTVGVAGSYNQNSFEDHHKIGKCEAGIRSWVVSLLSGFQKNRGYLNGIFNAGFVRYDDIERHFSVGPARWKAEGDTHGMHYDALLEGGWYFFRNDDCQMGPIANIEYQHVTLDGYKEHHADYNNLQFKKQHNHSLVTGLGLEALIWSPWKDTCASGFSMKMFLMANEDWAGGTRHVHFRQRSLGGDAPYGRWPIYNKRTFFGSGGISFTNTFSNGVILTAGYRGNWGQNHMRENSITANLSFPLWKKKKGEMTAQPAAPAMNKR